MVPPKSTPARPPQGWQPNQNRFATPYESTQAGIANNPTYFQCSDCPQIITKLSDLGRHWKDDPAKHGHPSDDWFTERAHMFKRTTEHGSHIEYYCVGKSGNTIVWKRCVDQDLTEGESASDFSTLIDQHGTQYYRGDNNTFVKTTTVARTSRRASGADVDGGLGSNFRGSSIGSQEATNRRRSARQAGLGDTSGLALSPEHSRADPMLAQRMSIAETTTQDLASRLERNDRDVSRSSSNRHSTTFGRPPANNAAMRQLGRSGYISGDANVTANLQYDVDSSAGDSNEDMYGPYQTVINTERSLKVSNQAAMAEARRKEARQANNAQSYSVGQIPPFQSQHPSGYGLLNAGPSVMPPAPSPYAGYHGTMYQNEKVSFPSYYSPTELPTAVQTMTQSSPLTAFTPNPSQQLKSEPSDHANIVHPQNPPAAQTRPTDQTWNATNRASSSVHPTSAPLRNRGSDHPTTDRNERSADRNDRSASPQEREKRRRQRDARFFEAGRRHGRAEERSAARSLDEALARAQNATVDGEEMDEVEG